MIYTVKNSNYYTFETFGKNKLPPRAYFIPFSDKKKALSMSVTEARYSSDLVTCLSGAWDFCFFKEPKKLGEEFDTDSACFDKVTVPSVWEYTGYLDPMYVGTFIPFCFDPPRIPKENEIGLYRGAKNILRPFFAFGQYNSVGVYRKKFSAEKLAEKTYTISFLGVASCLDLYLNGKFVGYSEGSHNTAEFLLDDYLVEGENELVAVVHRFSTGTYLELQDMYRNNGIFRDVLLYATDKTHVLDYEVKTEFEEGKGYRLSIDVEVKSGTKSDFVTVELLEKEYKVFCDQNGKISITIDEINVKEWSPEIPNLYTLTIGLNDREYICERVGFRHIEIQEEAFLFNGQKIKLLGVNHHDTHPVRGSAMTVEDMETDVKLMKEYNVNAVRTSHYPPDPVFIRLCREYGIYIVEEADIETHGACITHDFSKISKDPKWKEHFLDRVKRMQARDKNVCAVVLWSLGNESGGLACQKYCYDYLKTVTTVPVHYEWNGAEEKVSFDLVSEMYSPIEAMEERGKARLADPKRRKPYFLCEYAHAMGVGPGSLDNYVELFLSSDIYLGGCIWEWADHSVYHPENGNFTFGGDHHDYINDGNFCIDGLFRPDRKPYTSAYVMKSAYRPLRAKYLGDGKVMFTNINRFLTTDYLTVLVALAGETTGQEETLPLSLQPTESTVLTFPVGAGDSFLNIKCVEKATGRIVSEEQVVMNEVIPERTPGAGKIDVKKENNHLVVTAKNGLLVTFDLKKGGILSYKVGGTELINEPHNRHGVPGIYTEIYRAPLCNDRRIKRRWKLKGLSSYRMGLVKAKVSREDNCVKVAFSYPLLNIIFPIASIKDEYVFYADGTLEVRSSFAPHISEMLPRVGKTLEIGSPFDRVRYYGRGEMENYPDMKKHTKIGVFEEKGDFGMRMIVPQNSGERCDVRWAEITNGSGTGIRVEAVQNPFGLNVNHYSERDMKKWKHIIDYRDGDATYVNIDGFLCGVGSNSCGPLPEEQYRIPQGKKLTYAFRLLPIKGK